MVPALNTVVAVLLWIVQFLSLTNGAIDRHIKFRPLLIKTTTIIATTTEPTSTSTTTMKSSTAETEVTDERASVSAITAQPPQDTRRELPACPTFNTALLSRTIRGPPMPRFSERQTALLPGKNVHCSRVKQSTSGLDCPCDGIGLPCAPPGSVCSNFGATFPTCGCNQAVTMRKGHRCETVNNGFPGRGTGFKIFSPAPVIEVSCRTQACSSIGTINRIMGATPFSWTVEKTFTTLSGKEGDPVDALFLEMDSVDASIRVKPFSVDCRNDSRLLFSNATWPTPEVRVYSVSATDRDGVTSNTIPLTVGSCFTVSQVRERGS
ncbi:hypothetical protein RvY_07882 [Ramazzottius varieornatus]|uniref:EGF-like domain-containing protein n=1 Tax=Ramazzottius varieornatus TaxID=947166 RepID=A0A1D1V3U5_RAMVA|nr:hypothetical protein RvY_07882 [Ramazzottius varieornatus]